MIVVRSHWLREGISRNGTGSIATKAHIPKRDQIVIRSGRHRHVVGGQCQAADGRGVSSETTSDSCTSRPTTAQIDLKNIVALACQEPVWRRLRPDDVPHVPALAECPSAVTGRERHPTRHHRMHGLLPARIPDLQKAGIMARGEIVSSLARPCDSRDCTAQIRVAARQADVVCIVRWSRWRHLLDGR